MKKPSLDDKLRKRDPELFAEKSAEQAAHLADEGANWPWLFDEFEKELESEFPEAFRRFMAAEEKLQQQRAAQLQRTSSVPTPDLSEKGTFRALVEMCETVAPSVSVHLDGDAVGEVIWMNLRRSFEELFPGHHHYSLEEIDSTLIGANVHAVKLRAADIVRERFPEFCKALLPVAISEAISLAFTERPPRPETPSREQSESSKRVETDLKAFAAFVINRHWPTSRGVVRSRGIEESNREIRARYAEIKKERQEAGERDNGKQDILPILAKEFYWTGLDENGLDQVMWPRKAKPKKRAARAKKQNLA